jgi:flagellar protein FlbT
MPGLVIELRPDEVLIVNGAPIRFRNRARIELAQRVRFLFGKQVLAPEEAKTPARRLYFALQTAYIGEEEEREVGLSDARELALAFADATTSPVVRALCVTALQAAEDGRHYDALKLARRLIRHEDAVLSPAPTAAAGNV